MLSAAHASPRTAAAGRRRYEPIAQIGRGGMAEVLLTMAHAGGGVFRLEVLKRIWPELAADPDFVAMFLDEARLSLRLNHPNVVQTHEVLVSEGELAIAMEYLDGQPLTRILNRLLRGPGALSLPLRLRMLTCVLGGLEHAHTLTDLDGKPLGVVHRDVSPPNVFVTYDGQVKLVDFGVAKTLAASHHTRPGAIKGKIAYMAPEQLQSSSVDRRADIFAVGVMLWEMLAERRMWHRMTEVEIVGHLAAGRPMPPLPVPPDSSLPAGLDAICARALDVDPDRRYQTAQELEIELEGVLVGAADSHARNLGKVVSMAFAKERAERHALVERSVRSRSQSQSKQQRPATAARSGRREAITAIEIPVDDLQRDLRERRERREQGEQCESDETPALLVPPRLIRQPADWWRRAAAICGLLAAVTTSLLAAGFRRGPSADARRAPGAVAAVAPPAPAASAGGRHAAGGLAFELLPVAPRSQPARPAGARGEEHGHHRHQRRRPAGEENAILPPSSADTGGIDNRP